MEKKRKGEGTFKGFPFKRKFRDAKGGKLKARSPLAPPRRVRAFSIFLEPTLSRFHILPSPNPRFCHGRTPLPPLLGSPEARSSSLPGHVRPNRKRPFCTAHPTRAGALKGVHVTTIHHSTAIRNTLEGFGTPNATQTHAHAHLKMRPSRGWVPTAHQTDAEMLQFGTAPPSSPTTRRTTREHATD
jgi:hypothetical protein